MEKKSSVELPNEIVLITDYRNTFYSSKKNEKLLCSMDISEIEKAFERNGFRLKVLQFSDVDFSSDWANKFVIYQSAEDPGLHYRSYVEDVVMGLGLLGACMIPSFPFLRAHNNKSFFEIFRKTLLSNDIDNLKTSIFGTYEDFLKCEVSYPAVIKTSSGAGSSGVQLASSRQEADRIVKKITFSGYDIDFAKELLRRVLTPGRVPHSVHRNKFIIQEFIPGLDHDFRVQFYGPRAFVMRRGVRANDFRASGSGKFGWPEELPEGLLDFGWKVARAFDVPHVSMDLAVQGSQFYLIEAQFLQFGTSAVERAQHHWEREGQGWHKTTGPSVLESVFADGIIWYLNKQVGGAH